MVQVATKRIVYENWEPRDIVTEVAKNEFMLMPLESLKLDMHYAVAGML